MQKNTLYLLHNISFYFLLAFTSTSFFSYFTIFPDYDILFIIMGFGFITVRFLLYVSQGTFIVLTKSTIKLG